MPASWEKAGEELLQRLGRRVRERRTAQALTLRELAAASGVSQRFLGSVEQGTANISVLRLSAIAVALGTSAAGLLGGGEPDVVAARGTVALLGLRGAGKSTIGAHAAARLGVPFIEVDRLIAERAGMTLGAIFSMHGSAYYRRIEEEVAGSLPTGGPSIVAAGGGIVTNHAAYDRLRQRTTTVFLRATAEDHWSRVVAQGDARPMAHRADAMDELRGLLRARRALYERADHTIDTSALGLERSIEALVRIARQATR